MATTYRTSASRSVTMRNTYFLLALTLIPTVIGSWLGLNLGFAQFSAVHPILAPVIYFIVALVMMGGVFLTKDSPAGVAFLLAFTFVIGVSLSAELSSVLHHANGAKLIMLAAGGTAVIFAAMAVIGTVSTVNFAKMGPILAILLMVIVVAAIANIFLKLPALMLIISVASIIVFSLYLIYDINQIVTGGETSAVIATLQIYLDLINIFVSLLNILSALSGDDD